MKLERKPRLLDLFCGAGGAAMGYYRAGFEVVGVDIKPQPHYPFEFHQADALTYSLEGFDAYHASPPCQFGSRMTAARCRASHKNHIPDTQKRLRELGKPYAIENIPDNKAWLDNPLMLCGVSFGLYLHRHRYFETNPEIYSLLNTCAPIKEPIFLREQPVTKNGRREYRAQEIRDAIKIDWMVKTELDDAIPPAYTEYIGKYLMQAVLAQEVLL